MTPMEQYGVMFCYQATIFVHMMEFFPPMKLQNSYVDQKMSKEPESPKW